jgi:hypothetical protein
VSDTVTINSQWDEGPDYSDLVGKTFTFTNHHTIPDGAYLITAARAIGEGGIAFTLDGIPGEVTLRP